MKNNDAKKKRLKSGASPFGHSLATEAYWRRLVREGLKHAATPFYLFSAEPVAAALGELDKQLAGVGVPVRHWLSCKTQPVRPLLRWWRAQGRPIEVVSEFEFQAAVKEGFTPDQILVNGPAKRHWLPRYPLRGLSVNFDSVDEMLALAPLAQRCRWRLGIRCAIPEDSGAIGHPAQFGVPLNDVPFGLLFLSRSKLPVEIVHFHLRTNVGSAASYGRALDAVAAMCREANFRPTIVDCGGGFPPAHTFPADAALFAEASGPRPAKAYDAHFNFAALRQVYRRAARQFPGLKEIWLENGRFLFARAGALVVKVLETKLRGRLQQLICDGGRTTHALISTWEQHQLLMLRRRPGPEVLTAVHGPTCMAFDELACRPLPFLKAGDHLIWMEAGAYHIPWETRFSHGLAAVLWHEDKRIKVARNAERFEEWWGQWR